MSDGGIETSLIFHQGIDLPCFATFPLLEREEGREAISSYFAPYLEIARLHGTGFVVEAATWRANPSWGAQLGYTGAALADANRRAIAFCEELRDREEEPGRPFPISAPVGPEGDGYAPAERLSADDAERFHRWQLGVLADTAADLATAMTITYVEEAIGIARAASAAGLPVAIGFTVETDGRLPTGQPLAEAIDEVDADTDSSVAYFMVNCAHPTHFRRVLEGPGPWHRLRAVRANASTKSHAELDEATELDDGDPVAFGTDHLPLLELLPQLTVLGGCCGTDHRHVASAVDAWLREPATPAAG